MVSTLPYTLPYIYFGGKRSIAPVVWQYFGNVKTYIEPFFGGGAVFWLRPQEHFRSGRRWELLNDLDGFIVNFLRAVHHDPAGVAYYANWCVTEIDLTARHLWLVHQREDLINKLESDPEYYDCKIAGWWVWGINNWIGKGWCSGDGPWTLRAGKIQLQIGSHLRGVLGVSKQKPSIGSNARGILGEENLIDYFACLSNRLRGNICKIICGDWKRSLTPSCTIHSGVPVGVFLDPPYADDRYRNIYNYDSPTVCQEVLEWCVDKGRNPNFRIALCGYIGYYDDALREYGWYPYHWQAHGGYGNRNKQNNNKNREVVWFSPHCYSKKLIQQELPLV